MRVLLTGGTGFIGCHVVDLLVAGGSEVIGLRRPRPSGDRPAGNDAVSWRVCSLEDTTAIRRVFRETQPDVCLHMAWFTETGNYPQSPLNLALLANSLSLVSIAAEEGCKRFIGVGTCAEYDSLDSPLREHSHMHPQTLYGATKLALRYVGESLAKPLGMQFVWGRIFYVYGPREDRRRVVPAVINTLLDDKIFAATTGEQVRDFLHAEDVATAFVHLCRTGEEGVFNICSGQPTTMRSLLTTIAREMSISDHICFGAATKHKFDPPYIVGDNSRLRALGWRPRYSLQTGLLHTIEWWRRRRKEFAA